MPLFNFTQPPAQIPPWMQQAQQQGMDQYNQQGQAMIDPGSAAIAQSNPIAQAGRQQFGQGLQQAGQMGPPGMQPGMPMDADQFFSQQQPQQNQQGMLARLLANSTPDYPKPNFGGKQGVWG